MAKKRTGHVLRGPSNPRWSELKADWEAKISAVNDEILGQISGSADKYPLESKMADIRFALEKALDGIRGLP